MELKPCPWCGSKVRMLVVKTPEGAYTGECRIVCPEHKTMMFIPYSKLQDVKEQLLKDWNAPEWRK